MFLLATAALVVGLVLAVVSGADTVVPDVGSALIGGSVIGLIFAIAQYVIDRRNQEHNRTADLRLLLTSTNELGGIDLSGQSLVEVYLRGKNLTGAQLREADLTRVDLRGSVLTGAVFDAATLTGARLDAADIRSGQLTGCDLRGVTARKADLAGASLREARFDGAELSGVRLPRADLSRSSLRRATLDEADLERARLVGVDARSARMARARATGATLALSDLTGAHLFRIRLVDADLTGTRLDGAMLIRADLSGARASGCSLAGADLTGSRLCTAVLAAADLRGAVLTGCDLRGADLTGAALAGVRGLPSTTVDDTTRWPAGWSQAGHVGAADGEPVRRNDPLRHVRRVVVSGAVGTSEIADLVGELNEQQMLARSRTPGGRVSLPLGARAPRMLVARPAGLLDRIVPATVRLHLDVTGDPGSRVVRAQLRRRWGTVDLPSVPLDGRHPARPGDVAPPSALEELAAHLLDALDPRDGAPWQARAHLTRAIRRWTDAGPAAITECRRELLAAARHDPLGPAVNYALGALAYNQYEEGPTREAITYFAVAYSASRRLDASLAGLSGLILSGIALIHAQLFHRFGEETPDVLATSRTAARMAVATAEARRRRIGRFGPKHVRQAAIEGFGLAKYAEAFAQHISNTRADATAAIPLYEEAIRALETAGLPVRAVLYNNLGFQHMVVAGRFERGADTESYGRARAMFEKAVQVYPDLHFVWANLGNMHRLLGEWADAERCYRTALAIAERLGTAYPPGHNELAQVLVEAGRDVEAARCHERALAQSGGPSLRARFRAEYGRSLMLVNRVRDARASAELGLDEDPDSMHCRELMDELRGDEGEPG
ncbi:MAG: pentapeptide repeat-containing protein [Pseudonocardia sp.]